MRLNIYRSVSVAVIFSLSMTSLAAGRAAGLYGVWLDQHLEQPFLIVRKTWIRVAGCKFQKYKVLHFDDSPGLFGGTSRTYYIEAENPVLGKARAPIRDLDCGWDKAMYLRLSVDKVEDPGLLAYNDCPSRKDLEGSYENCSSMMLERRRFP